MVFKCFIKENFLLSVFMLFITGLVSACSYQGDQSKGYLIRENGKASVHEVSNVKLRSIMHKLDTVVFEPFYSELERDQYRVRYGTQMVNMVNELTHELEHSLSLKLGLNKQEQQSFLDFARQLKRQGQELSTLIGDYQSSEIKIKLRQLTEVCNNCHKQFRSR